MSMDAEARERCVSVCFSRREKDGGRELSVGKEERADGHSTIVSFSETALEWYTVLTASSYNSLVHAAVTPSNQMLPYSKK